MHPPKRLLACGGFRVLSWRRCVVVGSRIFLFWYLVQRRVVCVFVDVVVVVGGGAFLTAYIRLYINMYIVLYMHENTLTLTRVVEYTRRRTRRMAGVHECTQRDNVGGGGVVVGWCLWSRHESRGGGGTQNVFAERVRVAFVTD